jgi:hypothetical protein
MTESEGLRMTSQSVSLNPSVVTLNPSSVILSEAKDLILFRVNCVKSLRVNSVKELS